MDAEALSRNRNWVIVGASQDTSKYGNKIFCALRDHGYNVKGVNSRGGEIDGAPLATSLAVVEAVTKDPTNVVVDFVVPPAVTEQVVKQAVELGIKNIWMQPGSENDSAINFAQSKGCNVIHHDCILKHLKQM